MRSVLAHGLDERLQDPVRIADDAGFQFAAVLRVLLQQTAQIEVLAFKFGGLALHLVSLAAQRAQRPVLLVHKAIHVVLHQFDGFVYRCQ